MKRLALIVFTFFCALGLRAQEPAAGPNALMDSLMVKYMQAIQTESVEVKKGECDFLISSVRDSLMRQHLAVSIFNYYRNAPVMGDEEVAVYLLLCGEESPLVLVDTYCHHDFVEHRERAREDIEVSFGKRIEGPRKQCYSCQFIGVLCSLHNISLVREKCLHPKKAPPASGLGWAASST